MSNLSELLPAGGGGKNVDFVASGTLGNGATVGLKADGTVEAIGISVLPTSIPEGTPVQYNTMSEFINVKFDPNNANKFIIAYKDSQDSDLGRVVVGSVNGSVITFGTETTAQNLGTGHIDIAFDPNTSNQFVVIYQKGDGAYNGIARIGTISGTSITYSSESSFNTSTTSYLSIDFDPNTAGKFVVAYKDHGNNQYGTAVVGQISGSSVSYGSSTVFSSVITNMPWVRFDPHTANKIVISYQISSNSYPKAIAATISSTTVSFGSETTVQSGSSTAIRFTFDKVTANKIYVMYRDNTNSNYGTVVIGTISGTGISYGSEFVFNAGDIATEFYSYIEADPNTAGKFVVCFRDAGNSNYGTAIIGTVSGSNITYSSEVVFLSSTVGNIGFDFDKNSSGKFILSYGSGSTALAAVCQLTASVTNLTSTNFLGITDAAISSGASGSVTIKGGLKSELSSLTPNSIYYVQSDGSVTTVSTAPAVRIGKALSSTTLNLEFSS